MTASRRYPPATVPPEHPAAQLPRRRLAVLRPGMVVEGVITRLIKGGALVDIQLESGEPAFVPLNEIPAKGMPKVRELVQSGAMQQVRIVQLDRASGTATASLHGLIELPPEAQPRPRGPRAVAPDLPRPSQVAAPTPPRSSASERARKQQE